MRRLILLAAALPLAAVLVPVASAATATQAAGETTCSALPVSAPAGAKVESVTTVAHDGGTVTFPAAPPLHPEPVTITDLPAWCDVTVTLTHPGAGDHVAVKVSLPSDPARWSGRFLATGGSAYLAGDFGSPLAAAVKDGYVAAATDAGVGDNPLSVAGWALKPDGQVDSALLKDFSSRSLHDLAVVGKDVADRFYGKPVSYAYWNGCSTGGRQGYVEAQDYPKDFQGILADAPAISWDRFAVGTLWPQVVFNEEQAHPSVCELEAFNTAAVAACDTLDGVKDGVIGDPTACRFDPRTLIGKKVVCEGKEITISAKTADVVRKIWAGPTTPAGQKLWSDNNIGAPFSGHADTLPFFVADSWVKYFVTQDPSFDTTKLTYASFARLFAESQLKFHSVIGSDDPDLSAFARAGGKLLSWQGQSDELVPTQGTVDYRERVNRLLGGNSRVDDFYRLFLLPGVNHCGDGPGGQPTDAMGALVKWVEHGQAPATLATAVKGPDGTTVATRDACRYPKVSHYSGHGDPNAASSYRCR
ncbi:tannase/feruloyl esterase family alpha/beta hydrolase [Amycolatopsis sp. NPDC051903]|uniref:tannase/feruloyl esterase family alpha/beta hydrolase n=1 Tax=Amycolatopsis sp. NPDC051903 TaxID=3363936 RepID=UPI0037BBDDD9